jgi:hypothetical protein
MSFNVMMKKAKLLFAAFASAENSVKVLKNYIDTMKNTESFVKL